MKFRKFLFYILYFITFLFLFFGIIFVKYRFIFMSILSFLFYFLISFVKRLFNFEISFVFEFIMKFFIFLALICGEILNFYSYISFFDNFLHFFAGFISGCFGLSIFSYFIFRCKSNVFLRGLFILSFSMMIGVFWEFFEFGVDRVFSFDMQKDTLVESVNSVYLNDSNLNSVFSISDILYTIIYTEDSFIEVQGGYLDIGLYDTLEDMRFNMFGALVLLIFLLFNFSFTNKFVISVKK